MLDAGVCTMSVRLPILQASHNDNAPRIIDTSQEDVTCRKTIMLQGRNLKSSRTSQQAQKALQRALQGALRRLPAVKGNNPPPRASQPLQRALSSLLTNPACGRAWMNPTLFARQWPIFARSLPHGAPRIVDCKKRTTS